MSEFLAIVIGATLGCLFYFVNRIYKSQKENHLGIIFILNDQRAETLKSIKDFQDIYIFNRDLPKKRGPGRPKNKKEDVRSLE